MPIIITANYTHEQVAAMVAYCHGLKVEAVTVNPTTLEASVEGDLKACTRAERAITKATTPDKAAS
jgi:collagenase-like PrtC family protease